MRPCATCKYAERPVHKSPCSECKGYSKHDAMKIRTNGDRIRAMSDEELAKHFSGMICDINEGVEYHENPNRWLEWLKQPVKEGSGND